MSKYTTTLRNLTESGIDIFLDVPYPIFDEAYRSVLNKKILDHYYFREIGLETYELFKHYLKMKMNEIMPYYNNLYKIQQIVENPDFNPLYNLDTTETSTRTSDNKTTSEGTTTGDEVFQDTPNSKLGNEDYATNITKGNSIGTATSEANSTDDYVNKVVGSGGMRYPMDILDEYRQKLMNIDVMIINELNPLFLNLY